MHYKIFWERNNKLHQTARVAYSIKFFGIPELAPLNDCVSQLGYFSYLENGKNFKLTWLSSEKVKSHSCSARWLEMGKSHNLIYISHLILISGRLYIRPLKRHIWKSKNSGSHRAVHSIPVIHLEPESKSPNTIIPLYIMAHISPWGQLKVCKNLVEKRLRSRKARWKPSLNKS